MVLISDVGWFRYVPIVTALMFWPYAAAPIMQTIMTSL